MRTSYCSAALAITALASGSADASVIFSDSFDVSQNQVGVDFELGNGQTRQAGLLVPNEGIGYTTLTAGNISPPGQGQPVIRASRLDFQVRAFNANAGAEVVVRPDLNLGPALTDESYTITFDTRLEAFADDVGGVPTLRTDHALGDSLFRFLLDGTQAEAATTASALGPARDITLQLELFNTGANADFVVRALVFVDGAIEANVNVPINVSLTPNNEFKTDTIAVAIAVDEIADLLDVSLLEDGEETVLLDDFDITDAFDGLTDRYVAIAGRSQSPPGNNRTLLQQEFDNFVIAYIPEPSSIALVACGGLCIMARRRRST